MMKTQIRILSLIFSLSVLSFVHAQNRELTKPFYICEFAHAMFNSMGSLAEYSDVFDNNPEIVGGAIWEYQDQALWNKRDPKHPILAYGGGFAEYPHNH